MKGEPTPEVKKSTTLLEAVEQTIRGRDLEVKWIDPETYTRNLTNIVQALINSTIKKPPEGTDSNSLKAEFMQFATDAINFTSQQLFTNCIDNEKLLYHGIKHVMDTALNALTILYLYKKIQEFADIEISIDDIKVLFISALLHEVDDWWFLESGEKDDKAEPAKQRTKKIQDFLEEHGIEVSEHEIPYTEVKTQREDLLEAGTKQERKANFLSMVLHTADFAQIVNPAYNGKVPITEYALPALILHAIESQILSPENPAYQKARDLLKILEWVGEEPYEYNELLMPLNIVQEYGRKSSLIRLEKLGVSKHFWQKIVRQWFGPIANSRIILGTDAPEYAKELLGRIQETYMQLEIKFNDDTII